MLARRVLRCIPVRPVVGRAMPAARPVAAFAPRFMSSRVPLPEPTWKQPADLDNIIPSNLDQATGLERAEMLAEMEGRSLFDEQIVGPFGTAQDPVLVESIYSERIVGCPGHCGDGDTRANNEVRWFLVKESSPYKCPSCGQVFAIKRVKGEEYKF